jgi:hypothetical protein
MLGDSHHMAVELLRPEELCAAGVDALEKRIWLGGDVAVQASRELLRRAIDEAFMEERAALLGSRVPCGVAANKPFF